MSDYNSVRRSVARGAKARNTSSINDGSKAMSQAKKSHKGTYITEFVKSFQKVNESDVELRNTYAKDLISKNVNVPPDMITLRYKGKGKQTLTSLDEVSYVKVGKENYGKISIRIQRIGKSINLLFVFQKKKLFANKKPKKSYSTVPKYSKTTKGQKQQSRRDSYNRRK